MGGAASRKPRRRRHILVVMGQGGHTAECVRLVDLLGEENYRYSYILATDDRLSGARIRSVGRVYRVIRPRDKHHRWIADGARTMVCLLQSALILLRAKPDAVLTTGPGIAVPVCLAARLMGARILFVETGARVYNLSATGKFMRWIADLYFVQWEALLRCAPQGRFAGRLL